MLAGWLTSGQMMVRDRGRQLFVGSDTKSLVSHHAEYTDLHILRLIAAT